MAVSQRAKFACIVTVATTTCRSGKFVGLKLFHSVAAQFSQCFGVPAYPETSQQWKRESKIRRQKEKHDNIEADNYPGESQHEDRKIAVEKLCSPVFSHHPPAPAQLQSLACFTEIQDAERRVCATPDIDGRMNSLQVAAAHLAKEVVPADMCYACLILIDLLWFPLCCLRNLLPFIRYYQPDT